MTSREIYTVAQAAELLSCSATQVTRLIESGRLPASDIGTSRSHAWRITRAAIDQLLESRTNKAKPPKASRVRRIGRRRIVIPNIV